MLKFSACGELLAAVGENFAVSECYKEDFTLQNECRRRTFYVSEYCKEEFNLTKSAPQAKILRFQCTTNGILATYMYKISVGATILGLCPNLLDLRIWPPET